MKVTLTQSEVNQIISEHFRSKRVENITEIEIVDDDKFWIDKVLMPMIRRNDIIDAVKTVRAKKGIGLAEAKAFVDDLMAKLDKD